MKTIKGLQRARATLIKENTTVAGKPKDLNKRARSKIDKELTLIARGLMALYTGQTEKTLRSQLDRLNKDIQTVADGYDSWVRNTPGLNNIKNLKSHYLTINKMAHLKSEKKFLEFMLEG